MQPPAFHHCTGIGKLVLLFWVAASLCRPSAAGGAGIRGVVLDSQQAPVRGASLVLTNAFGSLAGSANTGPEGHFGLESIRSGSYLLRVNARGFAPREVRLELPADSDREHRILLQPETVVSHITVTATPGRVEDAAETPQSISVAGSNQLHLQPLPTIGNALEGRPGILVQQSTYGQVSPFLRGLTGNQVVNMIDGVRFNNSTFRYGPNQHLALVEPSQAQRVEAMLGPSGAQYGSDGLGGAINVITVAPSFAAEGWSAHGEIGAVAGTADASGAGSAHLAVANRHVFWRAGGSLRRLNDLRPGGGFDSRNLFRRYFGLSAEQIRPLVGERLQDSGFRQWGADSKFSIRLPADQTLTAWYQRGVEDGVRGYKDLLGGRGQLQASFEPQALDFLYLRYGKFGLGKLDSLSGTFSLNSQRDGFVRQGLRYSDTVIRDYSRVNSYGASVQATAHAGSRHALAAGGDLTAEHIQATQFLTDPVSGSGRQRRATYPNGSRYDMAALFAQNTVEWVRAKLRSTLGGRYTRVRFRSFGDRNRDAAGNLLGVADSDQRFSDLTFHSSLAWQANSRIGMHAIVSRGFRAPNLNDLGALGLNDLGYEVPAAEVLGAGAVVGSSSGESAASSGQSVRRLGSERLFNYETGMSFRADRLLARVQLFDAELYDPIVRRTLLFPAGGVPASIAGLPIQALPPTPEQKAQGLVTAATPLDPRALKAFVNQGRQRYYGAEVTLQFSPSAHWRVEANYSFLNGRELNPNQPVRRLPPQHGLAALRYMPGSGRLWLEIATFAAGPQRRLNGGDIGDERIGAERSRRDIADVFRGARVQAFVDGGADGIRGTADDRFTPTGETLEQIAARVLPLGATINEVSIAGDNTRVPLLLATRGYAAVNVAGGLRLGESSTMTFGLTNLFDTNYRTHGSGVDAAGIGLYLAYRFVF